MGYTMKLIAHRGNTNGARPDKENDPEYLLQAVDSGYDCEVDVWVDANYNVRLGHDEPQHLVTKEFISNPSFWNHAKNLNALDYMLEHNIHCFWHEGDERTLTSNGFIWTYPDKDVTQKSVICLTDFQWELPADCYGICSDWVSKYNLRRIGI
jgi:hypothetical protein